MNYWCIHAAYSDGRQGVDSQAYCHGCIGLQTVFPGKGDRCGALPGLSRAAVCPKSLVHCHAISSTNGVMW